MGAREVAQLLAETFAAEQYGDGSEPMDCEVEVINRTLALISKGKVRWNGQEWLVTL